MHYDIVPVVQTAAGPTVSDAHLRAIWERLVAERKAEMVFYAGGISTAEQFVAFMRAPQAVLLAVGNLWPPLAYVSRDLAAFGPWLERARWAQWQGLAEPFPETHRRHRRSPSSVIFLNSMQSMA